MELSYSAASIVFKVDDVAKITITTGNFPANWWLSGGISAGDVAGVWKPYGAASLADSYLRIAGASGNANLDPAVVGSGVAPTWSSAGWVYNGTTQYLNTGIVPPNTQAFSALVRFSNATLATRAIIGAGDIGSGNQMFCLVYTWVSLNQVMYGNGGRVWATPALANGILGIAGAFGYRNGALEASIPAWGGASSQPIYIAASCNSGAAQYLMACNIQSLAFYSRTLTPAEILAVTNDMQSSINLTTVPTTVYWGQKQDGTCQADAAFSAPL